MCDAPASSAKFTVGESKLNHLTMNNLIDNQIQNQFNLEHKYKSEKDGYTRVKSKSIAGVFSKDA
jgi:hypothetical protein